MDESTQLMIRLIVGLLITVVALAFAARRGLVLFKLIRTGQPAVGRPAKVDKAVQAEGTEVLAQKKLLQWAVPGIAHVFAFWGFLVLGLTIIEAFGALFNPEFAIPIIGRWAVLGFLEDLFGVLVLVGIIIFAIIRLSHNPAKDGRKSRFFGSHTGAAWLVLFMIFNVVWTLFLYRAAQYNVSMFTGKQNFPFYESGGAFATEIVAKWLEPLGLSANEWLETIGIWLQIAVVLIFLIIVLYSKHLHIFMAPINVYFSRRPNALGPLLPMYSNGEKIDFEDPDRKSVV